MEPINESVEIAGVNFTFTARDFKPGDVDLHVETVTSIDPETREIAIFSKKAEEAFIAMINGK